MRELRKSKEDSWIKPLRTLYPYGLNEKLGGTITDSTTVDTATGRIFPRLLRIGDRPIRSRQNRNNKTSAVSCDDFFTNVLNIEIDEDVAFLSEQLSCECSISPFCDPHHKHIVTGDLRVIEHNKLHKLFSKGLNYREKKSTNYSKCLNEIEFSTGSFITSTVDKYQNVTPHHFKNWEDLVLQKVRYKIRDLKTKHTFQQTISMLDVKTYLAELHKNLVIVPMDMIIKSDT